MEITKNDIMKSERKPVIEACRTFVDSDGEKHGPCVKIEGNLCSVYINPAVKWRAGIFNHCPLASHFVNETTHSKRKVRVGQQKQKKR